MRQRKVKNLPEKYAVYDDILEYHPERNKGRWIQVLEERGFTVKGAPQIEIGCGKGAFIAAMAEKHKDSFFIAVEGNRSVLLRAMEKIRDRNLKNVIFIPSFVEDLREWFGPAEVDKIFLNFSDPWQKPSYYRHRLTYRTKLLQYFDTMGPDGTVTFKTDNKDLFEFSVREALAADLEIQGITRDLHASDYRFDSPQTEYERKFGGPDGVNINWINLKRKAGKDGEMGKNRSMIAYNGRKIPKEDKIFGISGRAKAAIDKYGKDQVINATIGTLLDDEGSIIVLESVDKAMKSLSPAEYASYAPIAGVPAFKEAIKKAALGNFQTKRHVGIVASPGGTGSLRNAVANFTCPGDKVLTHDWHWTTYDSIAVEQGRTVETFDMFDEKGEFNLEDFEYKVSKLLRIQDRVLIILNTPANNPTGYSLSDEEWQQVVAILNKTGDDKTVALCVDVAYIDFAGETDETRTFLPYLEQLNSNIMPLLAYSASKTFTFYGCRSAVLMCLAETEEEKEEFERAVTFSSRNSWSNSPRGPQEVIAKIYQDPELLEKVDKERKVFRDMLLARGRAFEEEAAKAGLKMVPYRGGFFTSVPCSDPDGVSRELEKKNIFVVPFAKGVRVSVASVAEDKCRVIPAAIKEVLDTMEA